MTPESRKEIIDCFLPRWPKFIKQLASIYAVSKQTSLSKVHGVGSLSPADRDAEASTDLLTRANQLEKGDFLLGQNITVYDFSVASMLASILFHVPQTWLADLAQGYPVFPAYLNRVSDRLGGFPFTEVASGVQD